jgi:uncharacterized ion transporter superfamily protein YfcC
MAEANLYLYSQLAGISSSSEAVIYRTTADLWRRLFVAFEAQTKSRACYTKICLLSLFLLLVTLILLLFVKGAWWLIPLGVSILLLFSVLVMFVKDLKVLFTQPALKRQIDVEEKPTLKVERLKNWD